VIPHSSVTLRTFESLSNLIGAQIVTLCSFLLYSPPETFPNFFSASPMPPEQINRQRNGGHVVCFCLVPRRYPRVQVLQPGPDQLQAGAARSLEELGQQSPFAVSPLVSFFPTHPNPEAEFEKLRQLAGRIVPYNLKGKGGGWSASQEVREVAVETSQEIRPGSVDQDPFTFAKGPYKSPLETYWLGTEPKSSLILFALRDGTEAVTPFFWPFNSAHSLKTSCSPLEFQALCPAL